MLALKVRTQLKITQIAAKQRFSKYFKLKFEIIFSKAIAKI